MTLPPPAATTFAVSAPSPRDPPTMSTVLPANSAGATTFDTSSNEACPIGGQRKNACTDPRIPAPETFIRIIRNRSSVSLTLKPTASLWFEFSTKSIANAANSEYMPGQTMPVSVDRIAIAATRRAPIAESA